MECPLLDFQYSDDREDTRICVFPEIEFLDVFFSPENSTETSK